MKELYYKFLHVFYGTYTRKILIESLDLLCQLWPYLVAGILLTTLIKLYVSKKSLSGLFIARGQISIILAALIGVVSPLGSYVIIPLSAALFSIGVPLPPLMALLTSSPLIDPNLFILTTGAFGLELAVARTLSSFFLGVTAGYVTYFLLNKQIIQTDYVLKNTDLTDISEFQKLSGRAKWKEFGIELFKMSKYIGKYFFIAIFLAAGIKIMLSPSLVLRYLGNNMFLSVLLTTAAGIPFYVCGGAAIPVIQQLAELGMSKGAVLAFFISGPVTKLSNLILMNAAFKTKIFMIYLLVGIIGAVVLGMLYNFM